MKTQGNVVLANLQQTSAYLSDTGAANAYVVSFLPAITGYTEGLEVLFKAANPNSGPSTLEVDGYGPIPIVKEVNQDVGSGDILAGQIVRVIYDGTNFQIAEIPATTPFSPFSTFLIDGGQIVWMSGYTYNVSAANYVILGTQYMSPETQITLSAADPTYDRIDLVAVNNTGSVVVIEGTPSAIPQEPSYDPSSEIPLAFILVAAGTTSPACAALTPIYRENAGSPTEWTVSSSSGTMNPNSSNNPRTGSKDIEGTAVALNSTLTFTPDTPFDSTNITQLDLYIRSKGSWGTTAIGHRIIIRFFTASGQIGISVALPPRGAFGFNSNTTGSYQQVVIPRSAFNLPDGAMITYLQFSISGVNGTMGWYIDDISIEQNCIIYPPPVGVSGYSGYSGFSGAGTSGYSGFSGMGYSGYSGYSGGGLSSITADNAATASTSTNIEWGSTTNSGSPLLHNTYINTSTYVCYYNGALTDGTKYVVDIENNGNGRALLAQRTATINTTSNAGSVFIDNITFDGTSLSGNTVLVNLFSYNNFTLSASQIINTATDITATMSATGIINTTPVTITVNQSGGIRAISNNKSSFSVNSLNASSVITHMANFHLATIYSPSASGTITNYYGLLIEDQTSLVLGTLALINRWGIYQEGTSDRNYFAAPSGFGTSDPSAATRISVVDNSVAGASIVNISTISTAATGNAQKGMNISLSGANNNDNQTTYGLYISNLHTGTNATNVGIYSISDGSDNDIPIWGYTPTGTAIYGQSGATAILGVGDNIGIQGQSNGGGYGAFLTSSSGIGAKIQSIYSSTNDVQLVMEVERKTSGSAANGIGESINFNITTSATEKISNQIISKWTDATDATRTSQFIITGVNSGTTGDILTLNGNKSIKFNGYGAGTFTGTPTYTLQVDASGNVIEGSAGISGITADNGLTASTSTNVQWGGTLLQNTTINDNNFILTFQNTNDFALVASSVNSAGLSAYSDNTEALTMSISPAGTNTVEYIEKYARRSTGTPAAGMGLAVLYQLQVAEGSTRQSNELISKWTDATDATRTSEFSITGVNSSSTNVLLTISGAGIFTLTQGLQNYVDDAAAAGGGIPISGLYRNGSIVMIRVS